MHPINYFSKSGFKCIAEKFKENSRIIDERPMHLLNSWTIWPRKAWRVILLAGLVTMLVVLSNCSRSPEPSGSPQTTTPASGQVVYGAGGQPVNLEPGNITDGNSITVQTQIYDRLLEVKPGTTELQPGLATRWSVSEDGKTWRFQLRSGVRFHDDTPCDAAAVQFNVERWWNPQHPNGYREAGKTYEIWRELFGGFKGEPNSLVQAVKVVDPQTIEFVISRPFAAFPAAIGSGYFGIASPTAIQKAGANYGIAGSVAVGTGPFIFQEWRTGDLIRLRKNPNYWETGFPKTEEVVIRFITDPAARLAQLRAGQIDFTVDLAPDQRGEIEKDPNLELLKRPSFNVGYLALNPGYPPLADHRVRQAIVHAINKPAIVQAFWGDLASTDAYFIPPTFADLRTINLSDHGYNPDQAKQLLAKAGYSQGFDLDLWYMPVSRPYFPTPKPIAEALASDLSRIGIRVKLQTKDWAAYLADRKTKPGFQSFMLGWIGDYGDPDSFYYPLFGPGATADLANWQNPQILALLEQGRSETNPEQRVKIYTEIEKILHQELVRLPIVHAEPLLARRKSLQGWMPSPLATEKFDTLFKKAG